MVLVVKTIETTHNLQKSLIEKCKNSIGFNNFCPLYCTKQTANKKFTYITYENRRKLKLKACDEYTLLDVFNHLKFIREYRRGK